MPRQKFCSVPGCLSTTELIKREQESFLSAFCERCCIGRPCRCPAPDIYTTRKETRTKFTSWCSAIGLKDPGYYINVCYKHFSTGCPSRSCPNPDVVIPVWEKHVRDKINNVLKPPPPSLKKKKATSNNATGRKRKKTVFISLETTTTSTSNNNNINFPSSLPQHTDKDEESSYSRIKSLLPENHLLSCCSSSSNNSSTSSTAFLSPCCGQQKQQEEDSLGSPSHLEALLDQSEDPCLNEGNILRTTGGSVQCLLPPFSSSSNLGSFGDEFESVQKWLEICD